MVLYESTTFLKQECTSTFPSSFSVLHVLHRRGIDVLPAGTHALVSQQVGRAHLVAIMQGEDYGKITQVYTVAPDLLSDAVYEANALFVGRDNAVLYGSASGYLFAWDRTSAKALYGLDHSEGVYPGELMQLANSHSKGCVVQAIGVSTRN
jgi:hypothetical protein